MTKRKHTPKKIETQVLIDSGRRCCLCFGLDGDISQKRGQIAHLNKNPSNANLDNLAFLCLEHHDQLDSYTSQSKGLTISEVKNYRALLYGSIRELRENDLHKEASISHRSQDRTAYLLLGVKTGKDLVDIAIDSHYYAFNHDEPNTEEEAELIGNFLDLVVDMCEDLGHLGMKAIIDTGMFFNSELKEIEDCGFKVFGKRVYRKIKETDTEPWIIAYLSVIRSGG